MSIPTDRTFYLECAKISNNRKYRIECAKNYARLLPINKKSPCANRAKELSDPLSILHLGW